MCTRHLRVRAEARTSRVDSVTTALMKAGRDGRRHQRFRQLLVEASVGRSALGEGGRRAAARLAYSGGVTAREALPRLVAPMLARTAPTPSS
jgi:hypothetical protein